jgi:Fe-S oxidoreductase
VTYHDPCYLGRYNGGFDAPRRLIAQAGYRLHEMGRCRENSFCCGAGGGRIWMDDADVAERPSENRIKEALALGDVSRFVVACPKDTVMYTAAVQALGVQDRIKVCDIVDLIELADPSIQAAGL